MRGDEPGNLKIKSDDMKVAIYCRVSTEEQTLENQRLILEEHAIRTGWDYRIYEEKESTRKIRPIKEALMQELKNHKYDAVCVLKLDRWGRSMRELATEIQELYDSDVKFISIRDNIDLTTANGRLQFNIIASFAEFERDMIRDRTLDGLARAVSNGKTLGRPYGAKDKTARKRDGYFKK